MVRLASEFTVPQPGRGLNFQCLTELRAILSAAEESLVRLILALRTTPASSISNVIRGERLYPSREVPAFACKAADREKGLTILGLHSDLGGGADWLSRFVRKEEN